MTRKLTLCECAARDGLQHEAEFIPTSTKVEMINHFTSMGFRRIEATSFSHPKYVPQFADAEEVLCRINRGKGVSYKATCVNARAVERALQTVSDGAGPTEISLVISASETHQLRNTRLTHREVRREFEEMIAATNGSGMRLVGTIGTAFGCPFTGEVSASVIEGWADFFHAMGIHYITLGDTTGMANPKTVSERFKTLRERYPDIVWIGHFHDTRGTGLANAIAAVEADVDHLDSSFGGLGGHPAAIKYAEGHTGNVVTEDLVAVLDAMGYDTAIRIDELVNAALMVETMLGRQLYGRVSRAGLSKDLIGSVKG